MTLDAQEEKFRQLGIETKRLSNRQLLVQLTGNNLQFDFDKAFGFDAELAEFFLLGI